MTCACTDCACKKENSVPFEDFRNLAAVFLSLMEGDTHKIGDGFKLLRQYNVVDEDGFELYDE